jgi:hypothetical protein
MSKLKIEPIKGFDCIAFKNKVQEKIYQETKDMTSEQYINHIHRKSREGRLGKLLLRLKKKPATR